MRHHTTSIVGPDIDDLSTKGNPPPIDNDYPSDLLAACPMAREWGVRLVTDRPEPVPFVWMAGELWWSAGIQQWVKDYGGGVRRTRAEALAAAPTTPPPGYVAPPAQPIVGERLGLVAFYADPGVRHGKNWEELSPEVRLSYTKVAIAVRREVFKEGFAEEDTEAAAKALWNATLPGIAWDELREASRKPIRVQADAALSAALASRVKRAEREDRQ